MRRLILLLTALGAFGCGPAFEDPCEQDPEGCAGVSQFPIDPTCNLPGELTVDVGDGEGAFTALPQGQLPHVISGSQGGFHTFVGLRVEGARLDRYDQLLAEIRFEYKTTHAATCETVGLPALDPSDPHGCLQRWGERKVLLGQNTPLAAGADGAIEVHDIVVFLNPVGDEWRRVVVDLTDPCGRKASGSRTVSSP